MDDHRARIAALLDSVESGDSHTTAGLLPLVRQHLQRLARATCGPGLHRQRLRATALIHESWLGLNSPERRGGRDRKHFFSSAAEAVRILLVQNAHLEAQFRHVTPARPNQWAGFDLPHLPPHEMVLAVDGSLDELARFDPVAAEVVKLGFFAGLEHSEIAVVLSLPEDAVEHLWGLAKDWLYNRLGRPEQPRMSSSEQKGLSNSPKTAGRPLPVQ